MKYQSKHFKWISNTKLSFTDNFRWPFHYHIKSLSELNNYLSSISLSLNSSLVNLAFRYSDINWATHPRPTRICHSSASFISFNRDGILRINQAKIYVCIKVALYFSALCLEVRRLKLFFCEINDNVRNSDRCFVKLWVFLVRERLNVSSRADF